MKTFRRLLSCMLAALILAAMMPAAALASFDAVVTVSSMKVTEKASGAGASAKLPKGTVVSVKSYSNGIAKISYKGHTGYAKVSDMKKVEDKKSDDKKETEQSKGTDTTVGVSGAKVYQKASASSKSVSISKGSKVTVLETSGSWAKIEKSGKIGYIKKTALKLYGATDNGEAEEDQSRVETVIAAAKAKMGAKYVHGTSGPSTFDCSGFVKYAYKQIGVSLSGSAINQGYGKGTKVSYGELKKGDIVCFNTVENDSDLSDHTGIYLGGGSFIHCSSEGGRVMISSLSGGYYRKAFSWGRRIL